MIIWQKWTTVPYSCQSFSIKSCCKILSLYRASRIDTSSPCIVGWNHIYCHEPCILLSFILVCFMVMCLYFLYFCVLPLFISLCRIVCYWPSCVKWWWWWWTHPFTQCQKLSENQHSNLATVHVLLEFSRVWTVESESVVLRFVMKPATGCPFCLSIGAITAFLSLQLEMSHQPIFRSYSGVARICCKEGQSWK